MSRTWAEFWDRPNTVYVGQRHLAAHFRAVADELVALAGTRAGLRVLDFGCGEALDAARVAQGVASLVLCDSAPSLRERLAARFSGVGNIAIASPESLAAYPDGSFDLVFACSVVQYLDAAALDSFLRTASRLLAPGGTFVVADVIPPDNRILEDVRALLAFAWRHGFFAGALVSLVATLFSDYRRMRAHTGLATYDDATFLALLARAGLTGERAHRNFGENPYRRSFVARKAA